MTNSKYVEDFLKAGRLADVVRYAIPDEKLALEVAFQIARLQQENKKLREQVNGKH